MCLSTCQLSQRSDLGTEAPLSSPRPAIGKHGHAERRSQVILRRPKPSCLACKVYTSGSNRQVASCKERKSFWLLTNHSQTESKYVKVVCQRFCRSSYDLNDLRSSHDISLPLLPLTWQILWPAPGVGGYVPQRRPLLNGSLALATEVLLSTEIYLAWSIYSLSASGKLLTVAIGTYLKMKCEHIEMLPSRPGK